MNIRQRRREQARQLAQHFRLDALAGVDELRRPAPRARETSNQVMTRSCADPEREDPRCGCVCRRDFQDGVGVRHFAVSQDDDLTWVIGPALLLEHEPQGRQQLRSSEIPVECRDMRARSFQTQLIVRSSLRKQRFVVEPESDDIEVAPWSERAKTQLECVAHLLHRRTTHRSRPVHQEDQLRRGGARCKCRCECDTDRFGPVVLTLDHRLRRVQSRGFDRQDEVAIQ
jgi:hypothetical protein